MYGAVHPDRSANFEWYLPIARSIDDWNELKITDEASWSQQFDPATEIRKHYMWLHYRAGHTQRLNP